MHGDGAAGEKQASSSRVQPAPSNAKRGWNSCSNESAAEVSSLQRKRARVEIFRPGVPARISLSAFRMPDKLSPPLRDDDKDGHFQYELGENLSSRYKILSKMGEGTFGRVLECWDRKREDYVAIKIVRNIDKYRHAAMIELEVLNTLEKNDPSGQNHCVTLREWFDYRGHVCMVFEKLGLSLFDYMRKNGYKPFPLDVVQDFGRQLLQAVSYMHELRLVHTDLKPENILLTCPECAQPAESSGSSGSGRCCSRPPSSEIKVIDFGSATFEEQYHSCIVSTRHYRAPEVILGLGWSYPCDMWSIGCILIELLTGEALFQTHENLEHLAMMEAVLGPLPPAMACRCARTPAGKYFSGQGGRLNWPDGAASRKSVKAVKRLSGLRQLLLEQGDPSARQYAGELVDLIGSMLRYEPGERLTAQQALSHPFFAGPCLLQLPPGVAAAAAAAAATAAAGATGAGLSPAEVLTPQPALPQQQPTPLQQQQQQLVGGALVPGGAGVGCTGGGGGGGGGGVQVPLPPAVTPSLQLLLTPHGLLHHHHHHHHHHSGSAHGGMLQPQQQPQQQMTAATTLHQLQLLHHSAAAAAAAAAAGGGGGGGGAVPLSAAVAAGLAASGCWGVSASGSGSGCGSGLGSGPQDVFATHGGLAPGGLGLVAYGDRGVVGGCGAGLGLVLVGAGAGCVVDRVLCGAGGCGGGGGAGGATSGEGCGAGGGTASSGPLPPA